MHTPKRLLVALAVIVAISALALTAACSEPTEELRDVADPTSLFHIKAPSSWQYLVGTNTITLYAAEELPAEGEDIDALSVVIYVSQTTTDTPAADTLLTYVEYWAEEREWQSVEVTEPTEVSVGGRPASRVDITGTDSEGRDFKAAYIWIRTAGQETLFTAVTPPSRWDEYTGDIDGLLERWYWQRADDSEETPASP
ncbi:MAG: hypothetical protein JXP37_03525 [Coriobacteriia bacterium]|nr:hypothetical protein [Coriobacteriia bacterium]